MPHPLAGRTRCDRPSIAPPRPRLFPDQVRPPWCMLARVTRPLNPIPAFIGLLMGMAMGALDGTVVMTALPTMAADLGAGSQAGWIMTAYLTTATLTMPVWGKLSDAFGRRRLFVIAVSLFLVGSVACSFAGSIEVLVALRAVQGLGGGGLMSLGLAAMGDLFSPRERGKYAGFSGLVFGVAMILGPILGGALAEGPGWPWIFLINVPFGIASLILVTRNFHVPVDPGAPAARRRRARPAHRDPAGGPRPAGGRRCPVRVDLARPPPSCSSCRWSAWRCSCGARRAPPTPWSRCACSGTGPYALAVGIGAAVSAAQLCVFFLVPSFLQLVSGIPAARAGLAMLPLTLATVVLGVLTGRYVSRTGQYKEPLIAGTAALAVAAFLLTRLDQNNATAYVLLAGMVAGAGLGICNNAITVAAQNAIAVRDLGAGTSSLSLIRSLGQTLGVAAATAVLTEHVRDLVPHAADPAALDQARETTGPGRARPAQGDRPGAVRRLRRRGQQGLGGGVHRGPGRGGDRVRAGAGHASPRAAHDVGQPAPGRRRWSCPTRTGWRADRPRPVLEVSRRGPRQSE